MRRASSGRTDAKPASRSTRSCCDTADYVMPELPLDDSDDVSRAQLAAREQFENAPPDGISRQLY
jgi:hypothetical protein